MKKKLNLIRTAVYLPKNLMDKLDEEEISRTEKVRQILDNYYFPKESPETDLSEIKSLLEAISEKKNMELEYSILIEKIESLFKAEPKSTPQPDLIHRIMDLLSKEDLNTLVIAEKLNEDPSIIFLVLEHMKNENQIGRNDNRWTKI